jgi:hypothetical protein
MCVLIFKFNYQEATGKNVMLLPMGSSDDGAHSQNEKIDIRNYIEGVSSINLLLIFYTKYFYFSRPNCWVLICMSWLKLPKLVLTPCVGECTCCKIM